LRETKDSYCRAQYHRLAARRGKKRGLVAVGHSLRVAAWHVINDEASHQELGALHFLTHIGPPGRPAAWSHRCSNLATKFSSAQRPGRADFRLDVVGPRCQGNPGRALAGRPLTAEVGRGCWQLRWIGFLPD
jgi:hypothetical protein